MDRLVCGLHVTCVPNLPNLIQTSQSQGLNFVCVPLVHPRSRRGASNERRADFEPLTRSDEELTSSGWAQQVVGVLSVWPNLESCCDAACARAEKAWEEEMRWAAHLGVPAVMADGLCDNPINLARTILQHHSNPHTELWVRVRVCPNNNNWETHWQQWNKLRNLLEQLPSVGVALEITHPDPPEHVLARWVGEPVKAIFIPSSLVTAATNNNSNQPPPPPGPTPRLCNFLTQMFSFPKVHWVVRGNPDGTNATPAHTFITHLYHTRPAPTEQESMELPYADYLQSPLQPLKDNLESQTYETFEKDPIKYVRYEDAVVQALLHKRPQQTESVVVLMVLGAGRGPLVRASLRAADRAKRLVKIYAVEKNPNAVCTLRNTHRAAGWGDKVTIIHKDMRLWEPPEKADIIVSELLGSFGDNELSPECLDGANRLLKKDSISIPTKYTSFLAPVTAPKLWNDVHAYKSLQSFETPYVVKLHNAFVPVDPQKCFEFTHPNWDQSPAHNDRQIVLHFSIPHEVTIHGFAGYFHSHLYGDSDISIEPATFSQGMFSWFPLYFPLRTPMTLDANSELEVCMWRRSDSTKVWYEWCVTSPITTPIHNPSGRSYNIGL